MDDFFKNLRSDSISDIESTRIMDEEIDTIQKKEDVKILEQVVINNIIDGEEVNAKLNEISEQNNAAIEDLRSQSTLKSNKDNVIVLNNVEDFIKDMEKMKTDDIADINDVSVKLNEITRQSKAALERLKIESNMIIDTARIQSNEVLAKAKTSFSVFMKANHDELVNETPNEELDNASLGFLTQQPEEIEPDEETFTEEEHTQRAAITDNIMSYLI